MLTNNEKLILPKTKKSRLIQYLFSHGIRVFRRQKLESEIAKTLELNYQSFGVLLHQLNQEGWISQIKKGIYLVEHTATPIYEQEIAMVLVKPAMVSHLSAFRHHDLTDQIPRSVIQLTTLNTAFTPQQAGKDKKSSITLRGVQYEFIKILPRKFFGAENAWIGEGQYQVTDLERTLLDGLSHPQYCDGFQEVIVGFRQSFADLNLEKIIDYAMRLDLSVCRRLGWVLDHLFQVGIERIGCLAKREHPGYRRLDPSCPPRGSYNSKWQLQLNHHGDPST